MRAILRRMRLIIKVWLHSLLASAEDPRQVFALAQKRQVELLRKVREALATVTAAGEQLKRNMEEALEKLPQLEERARRALAGGREDQARFALQLRQVVVEETRELEGQVRQLEEEQQALTLVEHRLATQIEAIFARQEMLKGNYEGAIRVIEEFEVLTPWIPDPLREIKKAAADALAD